MQSTAVSLNPASEESHRDTLQKMTLTRCYTINHYTVMFNTAPQVILDPKSSRKIFELARDQQEELDIPDDDDNEVADSSNLQSKMRTADDMSDQSDNDEAEEMSDGGDAEAMFVSSIHCCSDQVSHVKQQLDSVDIHALDTLLPPNAGERRTLADDIFSKLENSKPGNVTVIQKVQQGCSPLGLLHSR